MPSKPKFEAYSFSSSKLNNPLNLRDLDKISKSRESYGVWLYKGQAWKIFPMSKKNYERMQAAYKKARDITPEYQFYEGTVTGNNGPPREAVALAAKHKGGYFFTLKDSIGRFKSHINSIDNVTTLKRIEEALILAEQIKLQDPQGFINANETRPLLFIDIHTHTTASGNLVTVREHVSKRIKNLQA